MFLVDLLLRQDMYFNTAIAAVKNNVLNRGVHLSVGRGVFIWILAASLDKSLFISHYYLSALRLERYCHPVYGRSYITHFCPGHIQHLAIVTIFLHVHSLWPESVHGHISVLIYICIETGAERFHCACTVFISWVPNK